jgi:pimeloyl-ACP methyl ester carboxylesterase
MHPQPLVRPAESRALAIDAGGVVLEAELAVPAAARGIVVLAQASGSSRHAPRNRIVAQALREDINVGTLLVDLLTASEEAVDVRTAKLRFDIKFLTERVLAITTWLDDVHARGLPLGLFAASNAAAAAIVAAADHPELVDALVCRSGRPDLAGEAALAKLGAPTLFLVGGDDAAALELHERAMRGMHNGPKLEIVPGAGHLFDEPGKLGEVARRAARFFTRHLGGASSRS